MDYYIAKTLQIPFAEVVTKVISALKDEGFGILSDIDVSATLKSKIDAEWRPYRILGACNPQLAYRALLAEDKIGVMLPCNVIVQERADGDVEVAAVNPAAAMARVGNPVLPEIAETVRDKLSAVLERL
ncbi:DUF302 domain-containing protein [Hyphomicrobium sp. MC8b]|uniref:DUF302 domain-containing protein n=1 Tax=Hyphomicrobium sp. MC8b TaxID=300273 RepID=UPI00391949DF